MTSLKSAKNVRTRTHSPKTIFFFLKMENELSSVKISDNENASDDGSIQALGWIYLHFGCCSINKSQLTDAELVANARFYTHITMEWQKKINKSRYSWLFTLAIRCFGRFLGKAPNTHTHTQGNCRKKKWSTITHTHIHI